MHSVEKDSLHHIDMTSIGQRNMLSSLEGIDEKYKDNVEQASRTETPTVTDMFSFNVSLGWSCDAMRSVYFE